MGVAIKIPVQAKRVFNIALPAIGEAYLQNLLGVVDTFFIAKLGLVAIDAVGVTNVYSMTYVGVFIAVSAALSVFLSRAVGAKNVERGHSSIWHGLIISFIVGIIASFISIFFAVPLLPTESLMQVEPNGFFRSAFPQREEKSRREVEFDVRNVGTRIRPPSAKIMRDFEENPCTLLRQKGAKSL